jgi:hypothetical protein
MITIITSNATTTISHADQAWSPSNGTLYTQDAVWTNSNANGTGDGDHTDQIGILITAHEDN